MKKRKVIHELKDRRLLRFSDRLVGSQKTAFLKRGENDRALAMLDKCQEVMQKNRYPIESIPAGFSGNDYMVCEMVSMYYQLGEPQKARELAVNLFNDLLVTARFYLEYYEYAQSDFELAGNYVYHLEDIVKKCGDAELSERISHNFESLLDFASGKAKTHNEQLLNVENNKDGSN